MELVGWLTDWGVIYLFNLAISYVAS